jgi:hypothetical protein
MDGINAGRKTIPFARFDKARTAQGLECLRSYRTEWDEKARAFKKARSLLQAKGGQRPKLDVASAHDQVGIDHVAGDDAALKRLDLNRQCRGLGAQRPLRLRDRRDAAKLGRIGAHQITVPAPSTASAVNAAQF